MGQVGSQFGTKLAQVGPKLAKVGPKFVQVGAKMAQDGPESDSMGGFILKFSGRKVELRRPRRQLEVKPGMQQKMFEIWMHWRWYVL